MTSCSIGQEVISIDTDLEYIEVYIKETLNGVYKNYISYVDPETKSEVITIVETTRHIYNVLLDQKNDILFGMSDVGFFSINYKDGTYDVLSNESTSSAYIFNDEIYYHLNIGGTEDTYITKICKVGKIDCATFDYYVSSYYPSSNNWIIVGRDQRMPEETFTLYKYDLDFNIISEEVITDHIDNQPPAILTVKDRLYYVYDSGIILDDKNQIIYKTDQEIFVLETKVSEENEIIIISLKDRKTHQILAHDVIKTDTKEVLRLYGNGFISVNKNGIYYSQQGDESSTFYFFDFQKNKIFEITTNNRSRKYISIMPLK